jgi:hypothetical protein
VELPAGNETIYYNFGFRNIDLSLVAVSLANLLNIEWEQREGDAHGGDYYHFRSGEGQSYILQRNHAEFLSWVAPNYFQYGVILRLQWHSGILAPDAADLLQQFSSVFADVIFFTEAERGKLTLLRMLKLEPLGLIVLLVGFFANLRKA